MCLEPIENRGASYTKYATGFGLRQLFVDNRMNDPISQFLLRLRRKLSAIVCFHTD